MRAFLTVTSAVLAAVYPIAIWWSLTHASARTTGIIALAVAVPLFALRFRNAPREDLFAVLRVPLLVLALLLLGAVLDDQRFVLAMPVLISLALLVQFASSLRGPVSMIERFARMKDPGLTPPRVRYCRQVTVVWCAFFVVNAAIAALLAWLELREAWALYTGGIAYALMGLLFVGERVVRHFRFPPALAPHAGTGEP